MTFWEVLKAVLSWLLMEIWRYSNLKVQHRDDVSKVSNE